jgi:hypothetical protein
MRIYNMRQIGEEDEPHFYSTWMQVRCFVNFGRMNLIAHNRLTVVPRGVPGEVIQNLATPLWVKGKVHLHPLYDYHRLCALH